VPIRHYICRESSTNQLLFMQNKPNVKYAQINVNSYMKSIYEKLDTWLSGKNKPNSNPIKPNFQKAQMNVNSLITKDYRKKDDFVVRINKPNFQNAKNERKLTYNKGLQKKRLFSTPKNKPNLNPIKASPEFTQSLSPRAPLDSQQGNVSSLAFFSLPPVCAHMPFCRGSGRLFQLTFPI